MTFHTKRFCAFIAAAVFFSGAAGGARAATMSFLPSIGNFKTGAVFNVAVYVSNPDTPINAVSGTVKFDPAVLEVESVSKNESIINLWIKEPSFSNASGTVDFEGITLNGYKDKTGKILTVSFKPKGGSKTQINFAAASILANDGKGSNVLTGAGGGNYSFYADDSGKDPYIKTTPSKNSGAPAAPAIRSDTNPNPEAWSASTNPILSWDVPDGTLGIRILVDKSPLSVPTIAYPASTNEKIIDSLDNGIWYFHLQLENASGWGGIAHYQLKIDNTPPRQFAVSVDGGNETSNPQPALEFPAVDDMSGIDYYTVKIDDNLPVQTKESSFTPNILANGRHFAIVRAVDLAGNFTYATADINIVPLKKPEFLDYLNQLPSGSLLSLKGLALANASVEIFIQDQNGNVNSDKISSDQNGNWDYVGAPLKDGIYRIWARNIDSTGASSEDSDKITIIVDKPVLLRIGQTAIDYLSVVVTLISLVVLLLAMIVWAARSWRRRKTEISSKLTDAEKANSCAFSLLREEVEEQVAKLDGNPGLSPREKEISNNLKKALAISRDFIAKKISNVGKELK